MRPARPRRRRSARWRSRSATGRRCARAPRRSPARRSQARSAPSGRGERCSRPRARAGKAAEAELEARARRGAPDPAEEGAQAARDGVHRARATRASRRAATQALDHALALAGCGTATSRASPRARRSSRTTPTARAELAEDAAGRDPAALREAQELVEDTRARLVLNVTEELALRGARLPAGGGAAPRAPRRAGLAGPRRARGQHGSIASSVAHDPRHDEVAVPLVVRRDAYHGAQRRDVA